MFIVETKYILNGHIETWCFSFKLENVKKVITAWACFSIKTGLSRVVFVEAYSDGYDSEWIVGIT